MNDVNKNFLHDGTKGTAPNLQAKTRNLLALPHSLTTMDTSEVHADLKLHKRANKNASWINSGIPCHFVGTFADCFGDASWNMGCVLCVDCCCENCHVCVFELCGCLDGLERSARSGMYEWCVCVCLLLGNPYCYVVVW